MAPALFGYVAALYCHSLGMPWVSAQVSR